MAGVVGAAALLALFPVYGYPLASVVSRETARRGPVGAAAVMAVSSFAVAVWGLTLAHIALVPGGVV